MNAELLVLVLRFAILLVLYLFLWQLIVVVWRDLHAPAKGEAQRSAAAGRLVVINGGATSFQSGHTFSLSPTTTIGRGPQNCIILSDSFISTDHLVLSYRGGEWWLADLGSRNGTMVNGERIESDVALRYGDVVALGQVKLKLSQ